MPGGTRVQFEVTNMSMMTHPSTSTGTHLRPRADSGCAKDTVLMRHMERQVIEFDTDNPGRWMAHLSQRLSRRGGDDDRRRLSRLSLGTPPRGEHPAYDLVVTRILVVDNYDSFVFTIVGYLQQLGAVTHVVRVTTR